MCENLGTGGSISSLTTLQGGCDYTPILQVRTAEAQRGKGTCLRMHSYEATVQGAARL